MRQSKCRSLMVEIMFFPCFNEKGFLLVSVLRACVCVWWVGGWGGVGGELDKGGRR